MRMGEAQNLRQDSLTLLGAGQVTPGTLPAAPGPELGDGRDQPEGIRRSLSLNRLY